MANSLGQAYVQIVPSAKGIGDGIGKALMPGAEKAGSMGGSAIVGKIKGLIAGAAIGATVVAGFKKAIGEGAALQQSMGGIETLFKDSADSVIKNARRAYQTAGMSANEYMENVTSFSAGLIKSLDGDTTKAAKVADMAMVDMSDNANKMGTDISSIQNAYQGFAKQNYSMLDNLKLGYGGSKTEMERLLADAEKLSGQEYDISNLNDVYEAIHVIQDDLGITGTTAKEASETISGSLDSMKAAFSDLMGNLALGENVEESMQNLIQATGTFLIGNLIPMIVQIFKSLPQAINGAMKAASSEFDLSAFNEMFAKGVDDIVNNVPQMLEEFSKKLNEIAPIIAEEGAFIAMKLGEGLLKAAPVLMSATGELINASLKVLVGVPAILIAKGLGAVGMFALGILKGVNKVATAAGKIVSSVVNKIKSLPGSLREWAGKAASAFGDKIKSGVKSAVDKVKSFFPLDIGKIFSGIKLPKINVSGGKAPFGIGGAGTLPKFSVKWNAEGGILDSANIIGIGAGEAGAEAIVPLDPFWKRLDEMKGGNTFNITMNVDGAENPAHWAKEFSRSLQLEMRTV